MLALVLLIVLLLFIGIYVITTTGGTSTSKSSSGPKSKARTLLSLTSAQQTLEESAASAGIDKTELKSIVSDVKDTPIQSCAFMAPLPGYRPPKCPVNYVFDAKTGCCDVEPYKQPSLTQQRLKMAKQVARDIAITVVAEMIIRKIIPKLISTFSKQVIQRLVAAIVKRLATICVTRIAALGAANAALFSTGPIGAAIAIMMDILAVLSITLDLLDPAGYNLYTANSININMRNSIEYSMQKMCGENNMEYPLLFLIRNVYPDAYDIAYQVCINEFIGDAFTIMQTDPKTVDAFTKMTESLQTDPNATLSKEQEEMFSNAITKAMGNDPKKRDEVLFAELKKHIPESEIKYVKLYPELSTAKTVAISLTEAGCTWWNDSKKKEWFYYTDIMGSAATPPDGYTPPFAAIFTNRYGTLNVANPKNGENYNMIQNTLTERRPIALPAAILFAACERPRAAKAGGKGLGLVLSTVGAAGGGSVKPTEFGVKFNPDIRACTYTSSYCDRMGLKFTSSGAEGGGDCKMAPGQGVAELIFGSTIVRSVMNPIGTLSKAVDFKGSAAEVTGQILKTNPVGAVVGVTESLGGAAFEGLTGGYKINRQKCKKSTDIIRVFQNKDTRCVHFAVKDSNDEVYDGQSVNDNCKGAMFRVCIPRGGYVSAKGTTPLCFKSPRSGVIHYDLLKRPPLLDSNTVIRVGHTKCDGSGAFYPVFKNFEEVKCYGGDCRYNGPTYNKYVNLK